MLPGPASFLSSLSLSLPSLHLFYSLHSLFLSSQHQDQEQKKQSQVAAKATLISDCAPTVGLVRCWICLPTCTPCLTHDARMHGSLTNGRNCRRSFDCAHAGALLRSSMHLSANTRKSTTPLGYPWNRPCLYRSASEFIRASQYSVHVFSCSLAPWLSPAHTYILIV
ncbi:hypothetical protein BKA80DRAFT_49243 [Phyllosticta citrichinensis]